MNKVLIFMLGAAAGSLLTLKIVDKKYREIAEEEIEAVREYYRKKNELKNIQAGQEDIKVIEPVYDRIVEDLGYVTNHPEPRVVIEKNEDSSDYEVYMVPGGEQVEPYVISPDEFGETQWYDSKCWTYYADFVLADESGEIVLDPESILGDALTRFGEYEDDAIHVRNENTECDYEILKHSKTFSEIYGADN